MRTLSTTMQIPKICPQLTGSFFPVLSRRSSVLDEQPKENGSAAYAMPIDAFLKIAPIINTLFATSSTDQLLLPVFLTLTFEHQP